MTASFNPELPARPDGEGSCSHKAFWSQGQGGTEGQRGLWASLRLGPMGGAKLSYRRPSESRRPEFSRMALRPLQ